MKKILIGLILVFYPILFVHAEQMTLVADIWCPFNCDPKTDRPGYMVEVARAVFEKQGQTVIYKVVPWTRAIKDARKGKYSGIIGSYLEDAPDFVFPNNELAQIGFEFFVTKEKEWTYEGISSFSSILLGATRDYAYNEEIDTYISEHMYEAKRIDLANSETPLETNIKKLLDERIDALIENPSVFWYTAEKMGVRNRCKSAGTAVIPRKAFIAFSPAIPESKKYAQMLSEGIYSLRTSGELDKILGRYGLKDWRKAGSP